MRTNGRFLKGKAAAVAGWVFVLGIVFMAANSCKHEIVRPIGNMPNDNGITGNNNGGNNNNTSTCSPDTVYFQRDVLPLIMSNCALSGCHDAVSPQDGIALTSYSNIMSSGRIRPGNPGGSKLYQVITTTDQEDRMPRSPQKPLSSEQVALIRQWISQGAKNNNCTEGSCDTANVSYAVHISATMKTYCTGCHSGSSASGGITLDNYYGVAAVALNGKLSGAINHKSGYSAMPKGGYMLPDCKIKQIEIWIKKGAQNN